jgi:Mn-dependent DtxR family transcriptional regulator
MALAVERGWLQVDESGAVALTEQGCELAQELGRLLY